MGGVPLHSGAFFFLAIILSQIGLLVTSQGHGTDGAAVRAGRYALICEACVYFHYEHFHLLLFSPLYRSVMSNIHAFLPAATFLQSCFLTQFALLATLSGFVSFVLFLSLMQYFSLLFCIHVRLSQRTLLKDMHNTCGQH